MDHDRFIHHVRRRAGVPASRRLDGMPLTDTEMAVSLTRATLQVLAQRISGGEARDLAVQLPRSSRRTCGRSTRRRSRSTSQLATRTGLTEEETRRGVQATLAVLDYRELLTPRGAGA